LFDTCFDETTFLLLLTLGRKLVDDTFEAMDWDELLDDG